VLSNAVGDELLVNGLFEANTGDSGLERANVYDDFTDGSVLHCQVRVFQLG